METYKQYKIKYLEAIFKPYLDLKKWVKNAFAEKEYINFYSNFKCLYEAIESIQDNPHPWVKVAIDYMFTEWCGILDDTITYSKEQKYIL